jgi:HSP20 family protein
MNTPITCKSPSNCSEANSNYFQPKFNVENFDNETRVCVELPGVSQDKLKLSVDNRQILLEAEASVKRPESWKILYRESVDKSFKLRLNIGPQVDQAAIKATLRDGLLTLVLPKIEAAKPRKISVN